jgi:scyllo-inositol 2-dehydrogenase (NADP+)
MLKVGLVGFGLAGQYLHVPMIRAAGMQITGVVSSRPDSVRSALPDATIFGRIEDMLEHDGIDIIVIATPNHLHKTQAELALRAGKHVVIDKPMTVSCKQADELIKLANRNGLTLSAYHNRRWDGDFLLIRKLVAEETLGEIKTFHARWDRFDPAVGNTWRNAAHPGSGVLYDLGVHLIDQVLLLFGVPEWVQADVFTQRPKGASADGFELLLGMGGVRITLGASSYFADDGPRYRLLGSHSSLVTSGIDVQEQHIQSGMQPDDPLFGIASPESYAILTNNESGIKEMISPERGAWLDYYIKFRQCLEHGAPVPVSATEARAAIAVVQAALLSSAKGRRITL